MSLLFLTATLAMGLTSCSNEENITPDNDGTQSVFFKVGAGNRPTTYADEESQSTKTTPIDATKNADLYFMDGSGTVTDHFAIKADASAGADDIKVSEIKAGYTFSGVSGNATQVYVVVNEPAADFTLPTGGNLSAIEAVAMKITDFTDINAVTMKGSGLIQAGNPATAAVTVAPVVARFEIAKVEYDATHASSADNQVAKFDLAGIFINNHHKTMGMDFQPIAGQLQASNNAADYTAANYPAPVGELFADKTNATSYTPAKTWAYQFFPTDAANTANDQPMLVIQLDNVTATNAPADWGTQFVSVNKFKDDAGNPITKFEPNNIYKITTIKFANRNLNPIPGVVLQDVVVTVTVTPWVDKSITPEL